MTPRVERGGTGRGEERGEGRAGVDGWEAIAQPDPCGLYGVHSELPADPVTTPQWCQEYFLLLEVLKVDRNLNQPLTQFDHI